MNTQHAITDHTRTTHRHRLRRRLTIAAAAVVIALTAGACQNAEMWKRCSPAADGDPFGRDGSYIVVCRNGHWAPVMTVSEYLRIKAGQQVRIAPVPHRPAHGSVPSAAPKLGPAAPGSGIGGFPPPPPPMR